MTESQEFWLVLLDMNGRTIGEKFNMSAHMFASQSLLKKQRPPTGGLTEAVGVIGGGVSTPSCPEWGRKMTSEAFVVRFPPT